MRTLGREARRLGFAAVEMRLAAPEPAFDPWTREGFVERNRAPIYMRWLRSPVGEAHDGPYYITDLDNDG